MKEGYRYFAIGERELQLGLYLTSLGRGVVPPGSAYPAPGHPDDFDFLWARGRVLTDSALVWIESGQGELETREGRFSWDAGEAVMVPPGVWHRYRPLRSTGWSEAWLTWSGEFSARMWQQWEGALPFRPLPLSGATELARSFGRLHREIMLSPPTLGQPLAWMGAAIEIIGKVVRPFGNVDGETGHSDGLVERARRFIGGHCHRPLDVAQVAGAMGVTRRTLERHFLAVGGSPREEIEKLRVARAKRLLKDTRMPVKEVAYLCGFRETRGLIRACRRWLGTTPLSLRDSL